VTAGPDETWPRTPPEVPPPRWPGEPDERPAEPPPARTVPPVPMVLPMARPDHRAGALQRTVLLLGRLDDDRATRAAAEVMTLDAEGDDEITLHLACREAELTAALMLAETIAVANAPVRTVATGLVAGPALAPFAAADRRVATPRAMFRFSEPRHDLSGVASEITVAADEARRLTDRLRDWIATATRRDPDQVATDLDRGLLLDADEAVAYGLVHDLLTAPRADEEGETT
jgi:ATP-dependent Clp protease protease subunit